MIMISCTVSYQWQCLWAPCLHMFVYFFFTVPGCLELQPCCITFVFIGIDVMQTVECVCWHVLGLQHFPSAPLHNMQLYLWVSVFAWVIQRHCHIYVTKYYYIVIMTPRYHIWTSILDGSSCKFHATDHSCYTWCLYMKNVTYLFLTVMLDYIFCHGLSPYFIDKEFHHIDVHGLFQENKVVLRHPKAKE